MARRRSVVRRAGAGWKITPGLMLAVLLMIGALALIIGKVGRTPVGQDALETGDDGAAVAGRVATGPARAGESFFARIVDLWNATARVQQLEHENRDLQQWRELAERLAERNARYEALLRMPADSFGQGADIEHAIAAQLVLDSGGPFTRTLVANAGSDHGVHVGFIAINENGLVGRVVSVGRRSSRVLMLDDYNSRIPVMGEASRVRAVLAGQATQPPELLTRPFEVQAPGLDFIVGAQNLRQGERVVTSGDGGLYPRGIPVGVARRGNDGQWRVALSTARLPIDFVRLIPFVGPQLPENAPVTDNGPPLASTSSVSSIGRETMAAPPSLAPASAPATLRPRLAQPPAARIQTAGAQTAGAQPPPASPPGQREPGQREPGQSLPAPNQAPAAPAPQ